MSKCPSCGADIANGMKFCEECGTPMPQVEACPVSVGDKNVIAGDVSVSSKKVDVVGNATISNGCPDGVKDGVGGVALGDKNVISGDVVGHLESYKIAGDATIVKNTDETKKMVKCHICGRNMTIDESFDCPFCHHKTCKECFVRDSGSCRKCRENNANAKDLEYLSALRRVYSSGHVDLAGRRELVALQKRLGLVSAHAMELEKVIKGELANGNDSSSLSTFEKFSLGKAKTELYENGAPAKSADLLAPIFKAHPLDESVLTLYLAALSIVDRDRARALISGLQVDILGAYLAEIDMALSENDVNSAEERLLVAEGMWPESNLLKCRRIKFQHLMYEVTSDDAFLAEASNAIVELGDPKDSLEASWILYAQNLISRALGDECPEVTMEYCKNNNLYFAVAAGKLLV